jgi:uncharacterized damage-inducible protein DinB
MFGYRPRSTEQKLRVAEALEELPETRRSLETGELNWSVARELTRVVRAETELAWLGAARGKTVRQVEALVSGKLPGDLPDSPSQNDLRTHALHFEVSGETLALFREAMAKLRRAANDSLDEDTALLMMARQVLGGPCDGGRASYQVAVTVCEHCGKGWQQGRGDLIEVPAQVVEKACCDAQHIGATHVGATDVPRRAAQDVPPRIRRAVMRRDGGRCVVPGCSHATFLDVHHLMARAEGGGHEPDNLVVLCGGHHRAAHEGNLLIEGRASTDLVFRRRDGSAYDRIAPTPRDDHDKVTAALCGMGFARADVARALAKVRGTTPGSPFDTERVLREALWLLSEG